MRRLNYMKISYSVKNIWIKVRTATDNGSHLSSLALVFTNRRTAIDTSSPGGQHPAAHNNLLRLRVTGTRCRRWGRRQGALVARWRHAEVTRKVVCRPSMLWAYSCLTACRCWCSRSLSSPILHIPSTHYYCAGSVGRLLSRFSVGAHSVQLCKYAVNMHRCTNR